MSENDKSYEIEGLCDDIIDVFYDQFPEYIRMISGGEFSLCNNKEWLSLFSQLPYLEDIQQESPDDPAINISIESYIAMALGIRVILGSVDMEQLEEVLDYEYGADFIECELDELMYGDIEDGPALIGLDNPAFKYLMIVYNKIMDYHQEKKTITYGRGIHENYDDIHMKVYSLEDKITDPLEILMFKSENPFGSWSNMLTIPFAKTAGSYLAQQGVKMTFEPYKQIQDVNGYFKFEEYSAFDETTPEQKKIINVLSYLENDYSDQKSVYYIGLMLLYFKMITKGDAVRFQVKKMIPCELLDKFANLTQQCEDILKLLSHSTLNITEYNTIEDCLKSLQLESTLFGTGTDIKESTETDVPQVETSLSINEQNETSSQNQLERPNKNPKGSWLIGYEGKTYEGELGLKIKDEIWQELIDSVSQLQYNDIKGSSRDTRIRYLSAILIHQSAINLGFANILANNAWSSFERVMTFAKIKRQTLAQYEEMMEAYYSMLENQQNDYSNDHPGKYADYESNSSVTHDTEEIPLSDFKARNKDLAIFLANNFNTIGEIMEKLEPKMGKLLSDFKKE